MHNNYVEFSHYYELSVISFLSFICLIVGMSFRNQYIVTCRNDNDNQYVCACRNELPKITTDLLN